MIKYILSSVVFLISLSILSQEDSVKSFLEKYNSVNSLHIVFDASFSGGDLPLKKGEIYFRKPEELKLILKNNIILSDGEVVRTYNSKLNRVVISNIEEYDTPLNLGDMLNILLNSKNIETLGEVEGKIGFRISNVDIENVNFIDVFTDENYIVKNLLIHQTDNNELKIVFELFELNPSNIESAFKLKFPDNARVIDLR